MTERNANANYTECASADGAALDAKPRVTNHRDALLAAAVKLIEHIQTPESKPEGLILSDETENQPDLYSLLEAMTALRQEASLQGRNTHQFTQSLEQLLSRMRDEHSDSETLKAIERDLDSVKTSIESLADGQWDEGREEGFEEAFDFLVDPLLDTHDQFRRLDEQYRKPSPPRRWFAFLQPNDESQAFRQTTHLTLKKLNQRLDSVRIVATATVGMEFDPLTMKAVELEESKVETPNRVLEIFKQGYRYEDRVLRYAEVKVSASSPDHK